MARSKFASEKAKSTSRSEHFWKLRCRKKCTPLRSTSGRSQKWKQLTGSEQLLTFRCRFAWQAQGVLHIAKSEQNVRVLYHTTLHYIPLHYTQIHYTHYTTLRYTTLHYNTLHYTTRHYVLPYTPLHSTTRHYTQVNYTTLQLQLHYNYTTTTTTITTILHYTTLQ